MVIADRMALKSFSDHLPKISDTAIARDISQPITGIAPISIRVIAYMNSINVFKRAVFKLIGSKPLSRIVKIE